MYTYTDTYREREPRWPALGVLGRARREKNGVSTSRTASRNRKIYQGEPLV